TSRGPVSRSRTRRTDACAPVSSRATTNASRPSRVNSDQSAERNLSSRAQWESSVALFWMHSFLGTLIFYFPGIFTSLASCFDPSVRSNANAHAWPVFPPGPMYIFRLCPSLAKACAFIMNVGIRTSPSFLYARSLSFGSTSPSDVDPTSPGHSSLIGVGLLPTSTPAKPFCNNMFLVVVQVHSFRMIRVGNR
ncbi:hypothetical protein C8F04DRAFT_1146582, partial [Mycena alexandri]